MNETFRKLCPDCETFSIEMVGGVKHAHDKLARHSVETGFQRRNAQRVCWV